MLGVNTQEMRQLKIWHMYLQFSSADRKMALAFHHRYSKEEEWLSCMASSAACVDAAVDQWNKNFKNEQWLSNLKAAIKLESSVSAAPDGALISIGKHRQTIVLI